MKIHKIVAKLADANDLHGVIDVADFNDPEKPGKGQFHTPAEVSEPAARCKMSPAGGRERGAPHRAEPGERVRLADRRVAA